MQTADVYLDHAATSPILPEARSAMLEALDGEYGNASALHSRGHAAKEKVEAARGYVARLINAEPEEIIFTSGGSESNNTVMYTFAGQKIAISQIEHPSVLESARFYADELVELPVDPEGRINPDIAGQKAHDCNLVSIMLANNELGTIEPVSEIIKCCKKYNKDSNDGVSTKLRRSVSQKTDQRSFFHTDATQAFGKIKIDVKALDVDYLTVSAHKIGGPIGVGALYVRRGCPYRPLIVGGHQEKRRRAGTTNVVAIAGFGAAAKWCWDNWSCKKWAEVAKLRDQLKSRILTEVPYSSCNSPERDCLPNILNLSFAAAEGESIQLYLDVAGIRVSTGSACAAGDLQPSHVIMATRDDAEIAHSSIRFSLGLDTTQADIDRVMTVLPGIIKRLQGISTIKIKEQK